MSQHIIVLIDSASPLLSIEVYKWQNVILLHFFVSVHQYVQSCYWSIAMVSTTSTDSHYWLLTVDRMKLVPDMHGTRCSKHHEHMQATAMWSWSNRRWVWAWTIIYKTSEVTSSSRTTDKTVPKHGYPGENAASSSSWWEEESGWAWCSC